MKTLSKFAMIGAILVSTFSVASAQQNGTPSDNSANQSTGGSGNQQQGKQNRNTGGGGGN